MRHFVPGIDHVILFRVTLPSGREAVYKAPHYADNARDVRRYGQHVATLFDPEGWLCLPDMKPARPSQADAFNRAVALTEAP